MKRGWCPGLYRPMPSGDGLLVRLRPPGGRLSTQQLHALADASEQFGNGLVELTGQARLQIRGLATASLDSFAAAMVQADLASADAEIESRRRVTMLPGGNVILASEIEAALTGSDIPLAEKFDVLIGYDDEAPCDIVLHNDLVWLAGAQQAATTLDPVPVVLNIARHLGGRRVRSADADELYHAAGLVADQPLPRERYEAIGAGANGFGVGIMFGCMTPEILRALATLGDQHGNGLWQLTRGRALHLSSVHAPDQLERAGETMGLITRANDRRRRVSACIGAPHCASATVPTRADAITWSSDLPNGFRMHISGCDKLCGAPVLADIVFIGRNGKYERMEGKSCFFEKKKQKTFESDRSVGEMSARARGNSGACPG